MNMPTDQLSVTFAALADPTRRALLARLAEGEASVNELAEPFPVSLQAVSKHLKVLERAGLITQGRTAQWRPCRLRGEPLAEANDWIDRYRAFWEDSLDALADHLRAVQTRAPTVALNPADPTTTDPKEGTSHD
jgi:DNA-binding transcriptional ArsR family regulator